jgi:hypothetical protein
MADKPPRASCFSARRCGGVRVASMRVHHPVPSSRPLFRGGLPHCLGAIGLGPAVGKRIRQDQSPAGLDRSRFLDGVWNSAVGLPVLYGFAFLGRGHSVGLEDEIQCALVQLLWVVALPLVAGLFRRMRQREELLTWPISPQQIDPHGRAIAMSLQAQGLSDQEALFLAARRCRSSAAADPRPEQVGARRVWLERALWVVFGQVLVILQGCFDPALLFAVWAQNHTLSRPFTGPVMLTCTLVSAVLFLVLLWKFATQFQKQSNWIGRWCCQRPVLLAITLIFIFLCGFFVKPLVLTMVSAGSGVMDAAGPWLGYEHSLQQTIIPVALIIWLANQRNEPNRQML